MDGCSQSHTSPLLFLLSPLSPLERREIRDAEMCEHNTFLSPSRTQIIFSSLLPPPLLLLVSKIRGADNNGDCPPFHFAVCLEKERKMILFAQITPRPSKVSVGFKSNLSFLRFPKLDKDNKNKRLLLLLRDAMRRLFPSFLPSFLARHH